MINPNRGASEEVLKRLKEESYERLRANIFEAVRQQLDDFGMTWDDLAREMGWQMPMKGLVLKKYLGTQPLSVKVINEIAHTFSAEVLIIFRPRFPYVNS